MYEYFCGDQLGAKPRYTLSSEILKVVWLLFIQNLIS